MGQPTVENQLGKIAGERDLQASASILDPMSGAGTRMTADSLCGDTRNPFFY
jgi:hypothetical protein